MIIANLDTSQLSRKEREKYFRKTEILNAALKVFAEKGFENAKLEEIAAEAEFGKGTLYNYFENKEELYKELVITLLKNNYNFVKEVADSSNLLQEYLEKFIDKVYSLYDENKYSFSLMLRLRGTLFLQNNSELISSHIDEIQEKIVNIHIDKINNAINKGEIDEVNAPMLIMALRSMIFSVFHCIKCFDNDNAYDLNEYKMLIMNIINNGLFNKKR